MPSEDEIQKWRQETIDLMEAALVRAERDLTRFLKKGCSCPDPTCKAKDPKFLAGKAGKLEAGLRLPLPTPLDAIMMAIQLHAKGDDPSETINMLVERVYLRKHGESDRLDCLYKAIPCTTIDLVTGIRSSAGRLYMVVVDDEGRLKKNAQFNPVASIAAGCDLVGNALFVRDHEGEDLDPRAKSARVDYRNATTDPSRN